MDIGTIRPIDINAEMRASYLDYAMSVIVSRALPDVRDGLKPVHRRILYAMYDMGIRANSPYRKSARIVGEVLGKYHPHGDSAVYDAMARMAQSFSMRYMLVDGQGNFGSIDGDSPAAMRYTEARLDNLAELLLEDIEQNTVDFIDNFDGSLQEPDVLPARLPNMLLNGTSGIAVGMSTNIPPHNLRELAAAIDYLINQMIAPEGEDIDEELDNVTIQELSYFIQGPDFPTGGMIIGGEGIVNAYTTGRGRVIMRAKTQIEPMDGNRFRIVVTEIPYQINKTTIIERIAQLAQSGRMPMISDLRDESDREGLRLVIELKRIAQPKKVLNQLFKYTPLQSTFGVQMLALVEGEPRLMPLKTTLKHYINHRREVIRRRTEYQLDRARRRAHVLEGLLIAIANLDAIIQTIRESADADEAKTRLMEGFNLTEIQAQAILDMQLRRLAALERIKIEEEYQALLEKIEDLEDLLANPKRVLRLIRDDLNELAEKYGDDRRTVIMPDAEALLDDRDLIADEDILIFITRNGYIKRVFARSWRTQGRGGKGIIGVRTDSEDELEHVYYAGTLDSILFFSDKGKVYQEKAYQIPDASRTAKGSPLQSILALETDERVTAIVAVPDFDAVDYCTLITYGGRIKRVEVSSFASVRPSGLIAISLDDGDKLGWAKLSTGDQDFIIVTANGSSIRFPESEVRPMGRTAAGVNAIRLVDGDVVAGAEVITDPEADLLIVTENAYGKRTPIEEYPSQSRYGVGVRTLARNERTGPIVAARVVKPGDHLTLTTSGGQTMRTEVDYISQIGRNTQGVQLMRIAADDSVASIAVLYKDRREARGQSPNDDNGAGMIDVDSVIEEAQVLLNEASEDFEGDMEGDSLDE
ncbi:MAG: DNA gyrase subunit A [Chloroflexi bacterium]|nr:DNA gyrase subunit A [Chloroflexota bacterium]